MHHFLVTFNLQILGSDDVPTSLHILHFRVCRMREANKGTLTVADNNILLQLGSVHEGQTPEEKERYIHGLKKIIAGMRDRNLKDVAAVAAEIVAYRAQFLGDRFRVLPGI